MVTMQRPIHKAMSTWVLLKMYVVFLIEAVFFKTFSYFYKHVQTLINTTEMCRLMQIHVPDHLTST